MVRFILAGAGIAVSSLAASAHVSEAVHTHPEQSLFSVAIILSVVAVMGLVLARTSRVARKVRISSRDPR